MLAIISPSKTQNFDQSPLVSISNEPKLFAESLKLVKELKKLSVDEIGSLMSISPNLSQLNFDRFQSFSDKMDNSNSIQALFAFKGDVYDGIDVDSLSKDDLSYAESHLRILSGLYGLLNPCDLIQPYRLEMKTKLANEKGNDLYKFWGDRITDLLNDAIEKSSSNFLINLSSNEYYKAVNRKKVNAEIVEVAFKEKKGNVYKMIAIYAKKARGLMSRYIIKNQVQSIENLKDFNYESYSFNSDLSDRDLLVYTRG